MSAERTQWDERARPLDTNRLVIDPANARIQLHATTGLLLDTPGITCTFLEIFMLAMQIQNILYQPSPFMTEVREAMISQLRQMTKQQQPTIPQ